MTGYAHGDEERTFAALPPTLGGGFTRTWWGRAWLKALEDTALDGQQLKAGRRNARAGAVGAVSVRPGRITAVVKDPDGTAYRSDVLVREFADEEWDRFLDLAVDSAGHIAALLDREMPPHLVEDAAGVGLDLLPGIGDLDPECGCEAWDHCPHTSALCYQVARLLDEDPFVLLLLRGRGERALVDELQARSASRAAHGATGAGDTPDADGDADPGGMPGVSAEEAYACGFLLPPLPEPPALPGAPGATPSLDTETDPEPGVDPTALEFLAADTAARAYRLLADALAEGASGAAFAGPPLTVAQDAVRLAAGFPASWIATRLATGSGRSRADLDLATRAWRFGGAAGLAVLEEEWTPDAETLAWAGTRLAESWEDDDRPALRRAGGARWTAVGTEAQVRLGADGRWWPYAKSGARWSPAGPPDRDPSTALATAFASADTGVGAGGASGVGG
ncbi:MULTISPECIES: SWF or SNF family helicase [unclassified Streptomyces]|uniref:SWF or SNF family helicase n=1 Tax=unclassified Streptomyces TaxID=2593676 RepID=UPI00166062CD|nr:MULTISPECIES: SWF or SNF family helicase [unclassified Streptomyces]MBD0708848.1 SWF or SNF family helicase [Streptomyces sp. CBMA291]MBD0717018.1 SWF or SNF family helicase [Streptomyces sp. CBMA370]